ncbi:MAG: hypothetical protein PHO02_06625 [Candidatus Nanoarchaeia archaeon]|nr:hypothetical protein [Candidatus Nanoarchaeia archaeon]
MAEHKGNAHKEQEHHNEHEERDDSKNSRKMNILILCLIGSLVLFGILVYINQQTGFLSTSNLAYYQYSNGEDDFNVRKVIRGDYVGWQTEMYIKDFRYILELYNDPAKLEKVGIDRSAKNKILDDNQVFITWPPTEDFKQTTVFMYHNLKKVISEPDIFNIPASFAVTSEYKNNTVMDCADAKEKASVIKLQLGEPTAVLTEGNCIILQGKDEDEIMKAADRLIYLLLGVMR